MESCGNAKNNLQSTLQRVRPQSWGLWTRAHRLIIHGLWKPAHTNTKVKKRSTWENPFFPWTSDITWIRLMKQKKLWRCEIVEALCICSNNYQTALTPLTSPSLYSGEWEKASRSTGDSCQPGSVWTWHSQLLWLLYLIFTFAVLLFHTKYLLYIHKYCQIVILKYLLTSRNKTVTYHIKMH